MIKKLNELTEAHNSLVSENQKLKTKLRWNMDSENTERQSENNQKFGEIDSKLWELESKRCSCQKWNLINGQINNHWQQLKTFFLFIVKTSTNPLNLFDFLSRNSQR